jgi:hypothetical protein
MASVFYIRCRPWGADAADIAIDNNVAFFGYPLVDRLNYNPGALTTCMADPSGAMDAWVEALQREQPNYRQQANKNRNMVARVTQGDIVMLPRPTRGIVYCGRVSHFELINDPTWAHAFHLLVAAHPEAPFHATEMAQCWHVEEYIAVPFRRIPAWIRASLFGRSTYGWVHGVAGLDPHDTMADILLNPQNVELAWTIDMAIVKKRLVEYLTPSALEHLIVALMQLRHPEAQWMHVGGSGDGGVDGIGQALGEISLIQCKWRYDGGEIPIQEVHANIHRRVLASLHHSENVQVPPGIEFLGLSEIAQMVVKYCEQLPAARSMRVGAA